MSETTSQPQQTSTASRDDPIAMRLPDETWLEVLERLDYRWLKRVERVCKRMQRLVKDKRLDTLLFRQKPLRPLKTGDKVKLHPLLYDVYPLHLTPDKAMVYGEGERNVYDSAACDEYATQPACTSMMCDFLVTEVPIIIDDKGGVTVRQLFKAIGKFWTAKLAPWEVQAYGPWCKADPYKLNRRALLGDRNGFRGWTEPECAGDGWVEIAALGYES
ncbi:hypothetical protein JCM10213_009033 [Rhodosporidiobolus nylandii]